MGGFGGMGGFPGMGGLGGMGSFGPFGGPSKKKSKKSKKDDEDGDGRLLNFINQLKSSIFNKKQVGKLRRKLLMKNLVMRRKKYQMGNMNKKRKIIVRIMRM